MKNFVIIILLGFISNLYAASSTNSQDNYEEKDFVIDSRESFQNFRTMMEMYDRFAIPHYMYYLGDYDLNWSMNNMDNLLRNLLSYEQIERSNCRIKDINFSGTIFFNKFRTNGSYKFEDKAQGVLSFTIEAGQRTQEFELQLGSQLSHLSVTASMNPLKWFGFPGVQDPGYNETFRFLTKDGDTLGIKMWISNDHIGGDDEKNKLLSITLYGPDDNNEKENEFFVGCE